MFDNLETAIIQALGFFVIFGFFVYQTLFPNKKTKKPKINPKKTKTSDTKKSIKIEPKKALFTRKSKAVEEDLSVKKKRLFGRRKEIIKEKIKPKKKGWFQ